MKGSFVGIWFEIVIILVLVLANGVFSMSETAVVSSRQARLQQRAESGDDGAGAALALATHPNIFLATVQIGITLIGVLSGAFGGATAARSLGALLENIEPLAPYADQIALILVVLVITYLSLIVGELVPKRLALNNPEGIAARIAGPMNTIARFGSPLVRLLSASTDGVLRVLRVRQGDEPPITAEEIGLLLEQGARAGVFEPGEQELVEAVFDLADDPVAALMTPRPNVAWIDLNETVEEQRRKIIETNHTIFPVCRDDLDQVIGVVRTRDVLNQILSGEPLEIERSAHEALFVPESMSALDLLKRFRQSHEQLAIVVDEFGGVAGLVTLQDVLEAIVGDIPVAGVPANALMIPRPDGSWLLDGALPFDEAAELLGLDADAGARGGFHTLAGFVLAEIGQIPAVGDQLPVPGWHLEIVDMDGHRIDQVLVTPGAGLGPSVPAP